MSVSYRRNLRSSSSSSSCAADSSKYWFVADHSVSLPRGKTVEVSRSNKENCSKDVPDLKQKNFSIARKRNNRANGKRKNDKRKGVDGVIKKRGNVKNKDSIMKCVVPLGKCKEVEISGEERKLWKPISAQTQSTIWNVISQTTNIVEKDLPNASDKRKLSSVLTKVRKELSLALAPFTEACDNPSSMEDSLQIAPMELNHLPLEQNAGNSLLMHESEQEQHFDGVNSIESSAMQLVGTEDGKDWEKESKETFVRYLLDLLRQEQKTSL